MSNDLFSNDNDFSSPPQPTFGNTPYNNQPEPKRRSGAKIFGGIGLVGCLGILGVIVLCCVCCVGAAVMAGRSPAGVAGVWVFAATSGSWDTADQFVCPGSQAEQLTNEFQTNGVTFTNLNATQNAGSDFVTVTGQKVENGQSTTWEAEFTTESASNFLQNCISEINVVVGDDAP